MEWQGVQRQNERKWSQHNYKYYTRHSYEMAEENHKKKAMVVGASVDVRQYLERFYGTFRIKQNGIEVS